MVFSVTDQMAILTLIEHKAWHTVLSEKSPDYHLVHLTLEPIQHDQLICGIIAHHTNKKFGLSKLFLEFCLGYNDHW